MSALVVALLAVVAQAQFGFRGGAFNGFFRSMNSGFRTMFHPVMNMFSPPSRPFSPNVPKSMQFIHCPKNLSSADLHAIQSLRPLSSPSTLNCNRSDNHVRVRTATSTRPAAPRSPCRAASTSCTPTTAAGTRRRRPASSVSPTASCAKTVRTTEKRRAAITSLKCHVTLARYFEGVGSGLAFSEYF